MPQPPIALEKYLSTPLPPVKEAFPPGGGATGQKSEFAGSLKGVSVIDGFQDKVQQYISGLPGKPIPAHPSNPYPLFLTVARDLPGQVKNAQDVQQYLRKMPLAAISASLSALKGHEDGVDFDHLAGSDSSAQGKDRAGYESDGGEEPAVHRPGLMTAKSSAALEGVKNYVWRFSKSPMGSGEFLLVDEKKPDEVLLVVRTINTSAFAKEDWEEFPVSGQYHYNTKSKASWYWSRKYGACKRLGCRYFVFTDYQRWSFGVFNEDMSHANISPVLPFTAKGDGKSVSVLETLLYWCRSALGEQGGYKAETKDVSTLPQPFADNPPRRNSVSKAENKVLKGVKASNESDIEESDGEAADGA